MHELCKLGLVLDFDESSFQIRGKDSPDALVIGLVQNDLYKFKCPSLLSSSLVMFSNYKFGMLNLDTLTVSICGVHLIWWMVYLLLVAARTCVVLAFKGNNIKSPS